MSLRAIEGGETAQGGRTVVRSGVDEGVGRGGRPCCVRTIV